MALGDAVQSSASTSGSTVTSTPAAPKRSRRAARAPASTSAGHHVGLHAEQEPAVDPDLLHVVHLDAALGQRARTAAPRCRGRPARSPSRRNGEARLASCGHGRAGPSRSTQPGALDPAPDDRAPARRPPRSGRGSRRARPRRPPPPRARRSAPRAGSTALAPSQLPEPMRTGGLGRPLAPDRLDRVLVGVVLVGDVDVGPRLDVVADHDLPVADDVRAAPDEAAAADGDDRIGRHLLPGRHAGREGGVRARRSSRPRCG